MVRALLARAYDSDPLMAWIFPDRRSRQSAAAAWLGLFVEHYVESGYVDVVGDDSVDAVAVWRMPDGSASRSSDPSSARPLLPTVSGLLSALVDAEHAASVAQGLAGIRDVTPAEPHAYLHFLAVEPDLQRRGVGRAVLAPGLERAEKAGLGIHLETTNADNHAFYQRLGFEFTAERHLGTGGPTLWAMWRPPAGATTGMDANTGTDA
ncbi:GNAT family N-acetyltransferase [Phytoactinopolyspora halotolerans]|uniref:GNAT family N-acetyltransferase n=1 Tax=Phytoactinopolyspora halotolerans TaxID=1981512 RepID=A0A6L9S9Z9_9ACTN|nr:GNAT family N-acetyltransferase [Phytoactinopolyspora halotolerans]NEE00780.1 GNAT family N-acetyltransferase [Phytoactinopolyspora halotolerans]